MTWVRRLATLGWAVLWAALAFGPLLVLDDLAGPLVGAHWLIIPPLDRGSWSDEQTVRLPLGGQLALSASSVDSAGVSPGFRPVIRCRWRDGTASWTTLPERTVPVLGPSIRNRRRHAPALHLVRLDVLTSRTGTLSVECAGTEPVSLDRIDHGTPGRLATTVRVARIGWPILVTLVMWGPVTLISLIAKRRRRQRQPR